MITLPPSEGLSPVGIRRHLENVIYRLKIRRVWQYIEPATRGWLELAARLEDIKFKSHKVLSVLVKVLNRVKPLLDFPGIVAGMGVRRAWNASRIAASWGNKEAEKWRNDKGFHFYWGLMSLQLSRIVPGMLSPELESLRELLHFRGLGRVLRMLRRIV